MSWILPAMLFLLVSGRKASAPRERPPEGGSPYSRSPDWSRWREECAAHGGTIKQGPASDLGYRSTSFTVQYCELPNGKRFGPSPDDIDALASEPLP
jgi:hypothetical protein